jgi:hypothetical protein
MLPEEIIPAVRVTDTITLPGNRLISTLARKDHISNSPTAVNQPRE